MDTTFQFLPNDLDLQTKQENFESEIAASDPPTELPTELPPPLTANPTKLLQQLIQGLALLGHAAVIGKRVRPDRQVHKSPIGVTRGDSAGEKGGVALCINL